MYFGVRKRFDYATHIALLNYVDYGGRWKEGFNLSRDPDLYKCDAVSYTHLTLPTIYSV